MDSTENKPPEDSILCPKIQVFSYHVTGSRKALDAYVCGKDLVAIIRADVKRKVSICGSRMLQWLMSFGCERSLVKSAVRSVLITLLIHAHE